jgi:hypothetical protein
MPDLAEIARRAGVTEAQARAVLDAAAEHDAVRLPDFAVWAAAAVVVGSVAVFMAAEDGFESDPGHKGAVLAVALVVAAGAVAAARLARRRGYRLGEQAGFTIAAALVPVVLWTLLWVAGLWPGHADRLGNWVGGDDRAQAALAALVAALSAAAMAYPALWLGASLAWGLLLAGLQALVGALFAVAAPDADLPDGVVLVLTVLYLALFAGLALALERRRPPRATWTWPYAWLCGGPAVVTAIEEVATDGVAWAAGLGLVVAAAAGGGLLRRAQLIAAAGIGGLVLDAWLYDLLDIGAGGALLVSLLLGLAVIGLTVVTWRRLSPPAGIRSST